MTMLAFFLSGIGRWIAGGVVGIVLVSGLYLKGRSDGSLACELKQRQQMEKVEAYVKKIRERVERNIPIDDDLLRPDAWQRDE